MRYIKGEYVSKAGDYLLSILAIEGSITYEWFYDGGQRSEALAKAIGCEGEEHGMSIRAMDAAVHLLAKEGVVLRTILESELVDGESNYRIELTDKGHGFLGRKCEFRDFDMMYDF